MQKIKNKNIHVGIVYPSDPLGSIPGGIETFIRGIIGWSPDDIEFSLIGITTDVRARPVGTWSECQQGRNTFRFLPLYAMGEPGKRPRIPATVRYTALLFREARKYRFDVLDSHRIEPFLPYLFDSTPKNIFLHQNMEVICSKSSDIRWKYLPWLYYKIEDLFLHRINSVYAVREDAVRAYQKRYPDIQDRFNFIPTWMDPDIFFPVSGDERTGLRKELLALYGIQEDDLLMVSVGRLDTQKDPLLLIESFHRVVQDNSKVHLLMVGDGLLRPDVEKKIAQLGLQEKVSLAGLMGPHKVARCLRASDMFVLSSAYEGMPMCVLEAMGCGLPVVTTDVGEVRRVVKPGINGEITTARGISELARAMTVTMQNLSKYRGAPCLDIALEYVPGKVLVPVYENYRRLAQMGRT
jgi:glycosyltransferase involved in cell wall biosynthesis